MGDNPFKKMLDMQRSTLTRKRDKSSSYSGPKGRKYKEADAEFAAYNQWGWGAFTPKKVKVPNG